MPRVKLLLLPALPLLLAACGSPPPPPVVVEPPVDAIIAVGKCREQGNWWACAVTNKTPAKVNLADVTHSSYDGMGIRIDNGMIVGQIDANGTSELILGGPVNAGISRIILHR